LCDKYKLFRFDKFLIVVSGMVPEKLLYERSRLHSLESLPKDVGRLPRRLLPPRFMQYSLLNDPSDDGRAPVRSHESINRY
jgi:hypothetical protein